MADSWKLYSMPSESEASDYSMALAECMQDELCSDTQDSAATFPDGVPNSDGPMNAQALSATCLAQDVLPISTMELDSSPINPVRWDSCRPPEIYSTLSAYSSHNHVDRHSFLHNLASPSTLPHTHVSSSQSSTDHIPFPYSIQFPDSIPLSSLSTSALPHECPALSGDQLLSSSTSEENFISISETLLRSNRTSSRVSDFITNLNHFPHSEEDRHLVSTRECVFTPHSESGRRVPVAFDPNCEISDRGSISEPEYSSGTGSALRRRGPRVRGQMRQGSSAAEEASYTQALTASVTRSPILRFRCVSGLSRAHSPSSTGDAFSLSGTDDCDNLPALLGPSDGSESDRPSSPDSSQDTETDSLVTSNDGRTRFLNPGTPIQTELPEIQSFLELFRTEGDSHRLWVVPETNMSPDEVDFQMSPEDDDITGDTQRAMELLDGLEQVNSVLVRRYEKVRGCGHDICTVCRDALLPPEDKDYEDFEQGLDPAVVWNVHASTSLPFKPPPLEPRIHAFPCTHLFHTDCLIPWLSLKTTCPTCRLDIDPHSLTLRVRGWASSSHWPHIEHREQYVNVDGLGRRIPWRRPPAVTLEEWVERRENETTEQREERLKLRPGPRRHSEPPPADSEMTCHSRRRTFSEPLSMDIHQNSHSTSLGVGFCESPEPLETLTGYFEPRVSSHSVTARRPRLSIPGEYVRHSTNHTVLEQGFTGIVLEEAPFRRSPESMATSPYPTMRAATIHSRRSSSTVMSSESEMAVAGHIIDLAALSRTFQANSIGRSSSSQGTQESFDCTYRVRRPSTVEARHVHTTPSSPMRLALSQTFGFET